jgi:hypothetical protein
MADAPSPPSPPPKDGKFWQYVEVSHDYKKEDGAPPVLNEKRTRKPNSIYKDELTGADMVEKLRSAVRPHVLHTDWPTTILQCEEKKGDPNRYLVRFENCEGEAGVPVWLTQTGIQQHSKRLAMELSAKQQKDKQVRKEEALAKGEFLDMSDELFSGMTVEDALAHEFLVAVTFGFKSAVQFKGDSYSKYQGQNGITAFENRMSFKVNANAAVAMNALDRILDKRSFNLPALVANKSLTCKVPVGSLDSLLQQICSDWMMECTPNGWRFKVG